MPRAQFHRLDLVHAVAGEQLEQQESQGVDIALGRDGLPASCSGAM